MPYTFGAATNNSVTWTLANQPSAVRAGVFCGWWMPTTLTATRRLWSNNTVSGVEIDTTTTQFRLKQAHATTSGEWTTSNAGLALNTWTFAAFMWSPINGGGAWRAWAGGVGSAPQELTITSAVAPVGNFSGNSNCTVGNTNGGSVAFQGDIAEFDYWIGFASTTTGPPFFLGAVGTITDPEADIAYRRFVLPAWLGKWPSSQHVFTNANSAGSASIECGRVVFDTLPVVQRHQGADATSSLVLAPTITGATVSQNGHPRPPLSSQLFAHNRRR